MQGWKREGGSYSDVCVFVSKANEFSESGSCIGPSQTVVGTGTNTRTIKQADLPTGISWEGEGNPLGETQVVNQGDSQSQVDSTVDSANELNQSTYDWSQMFGEGNFLDMLQGEAIGGIPNWALLAVGIGFLAFKDELM